MPIHNDEIARIFEQLADLLEIDEANPFRVRAYRNAARTLRNLTEEAADLIEEGEDLSALPAIGKDLAQKIEEIVETGNLEMLEELKRSVPAGLADLTRVPGLGPKRVKALHDKLGLKNPADLRKAVEKGELKGLRGFGEKTEEAIRTYFAGDRAADRRTKYFEAEKIAGRIVEHLAIVARPNDIVVAGSYRRSSETVGDLDILVISTTPQKVMDHFVEFDEIKTVSAKGKTRSTVRLRSGMQVDVRVVAPHSFGAALVYFTGSKAHNIELRRRAVARGLKINEYGVYKGARSIAGKTERDVYAAVDLPLIPPELREAQGEIEAAEERRLPKLLSLDDIRGDLHVHTSASDGVDGLRAMALAAKKRGYAYLAIADHTQHARIARGLTPRRLARQIDEIESLNEELTGVRILKCSEVDILADGSLDMTDSVLARLDLAVCAIHFDFNLSAGKQTERIIRAMDHPAFSVLAHPTCRLIGERDPMRINMEKLIAAALERGCFLEVNGQPERLDLKDIYCRMAKEQGLKLALSTDAHSTAQLDYMRFSVSQARRGWIEKDQVINTRSWRELKSLLRRS